MHIPGYVQGVELLSCDVQEEEGKERARAAVRETEQANEEALKLKQQQREQERQADAQIAGHCYGTPSSEHKSCMSHHACKGPCVNRIAMSSLDPCGLLSKEVCKVQSKHPQQPQ